MKRDLQWVLSNTVNNGECLEWIRCLNSDGYPRMHWKGNCNGKVHRIVYELVHGELPEGHCIRHICDNPKCINPEHLLLGTAADNMADRDSRERHGKSKLSHTDVRAIRVLCRAGFKNVQISRMYGIDARTVSSIKHGHHWKHI